MSYWIRQFFSRPQNHGKAASEVIVTAAVALSPLLITAVVFNYRNTSKFDLSAGLAEAIGGGQLFLYAYGLIGTIIWLSFMRWDRQVNGPRRILGFVTILIAFAIVGMLGLDPTISNAKNQTILSASYWIYGSFLFINYLLLFYIEIDPPPPEESLKEGTRSLKARYASLREQQSE
ncbi:hypothetical protein WCE34_08625 [Luteimonas sp. MJ204]|uniref:hypothetical protein n=1 Tax=Luteimonas sp. MJ145 TaxID=3129234 RepID=UPI0031BA3115